MIILLAVSAYFGFLYLKMKKLKKYLYFSLLCFVTAIYYGNYFITILPISYLLFQKIIFSSMFFIPIFFTLFMREFSELSVLRPQKINMVIRVVVIIAGIIFFKDLVSYYIFRRFYFIIFAADFFYIIGLVIYDYFQENIYIKKMTPWIIIVLVMCSHDIYFQIIGQYSPLGLQLNVYALIFFLGIIALDLAFEHINLYTKASRDGLTGLFTQSFFKNELIEIVKNKNKIKGSISLIMLDIDHFKKFNDIYGHLMGDKVLEAVSKILTENSPRDALVTRYGGEEFAILLKNYDKKSALEIAERLRVDIEDYRNKENNSIRITISLGITTWHASKEIDHSETLIQEADEALYYSKHHGRNKVTHFEETK
nr:GGDEF domain-containing protein [Desulfonispora thiosulfatigenes]